jgi:hypothetical protein
MTLDEIHRALVSVRALNGDLSRLQMWFEAGVLDKYRGQAGVRVIRTNTAGRVRSTAWSLDFGIAADDSLIHAAAADLGQRLPESERAHWAQHVFAPPTSKNFLTMRFGGGSCIDDGEIRDWTSMEA